MARSILGDDFVFWLLLFLLCAPLAVILLAWDYYNQGKRPERPAPVTHDFEFYE